MPTLEFERSLCAETGLTHVAGLDEAGRGAVAGPVVAAAVILPLFAPERLAELDGVNDSKQLSASSRERLYELIVVHALSFGIGFTSAERIDQMGIIPATKMAMLAALSQLTPAAQCLLIDGRIRLKNNPLPQQSIIRGDSKSVSIAAASILAKVSRDRHMVEMDERYPLFGFAQHKGYGTKRHLAALSELAPTTIHRHSFAPIRHTLV